MSSILIKNARIVTMNSRREVLDGNLLVKDDRIAAIGSELYEADQTIDAKGNLLIPGLIQTHVHLCQTLFRGMADDLELLDWLRKRIWPLEGAHDEDSVYDSAVLGIGELFACGTTAIVDMETVHHTASAFHAILETGMRAISGKCMMDWGEDVPAGLMETAEASLRESEALCQKWNGAGNGRLHYAFTPRFAVSCSEELMREVGALSRKYGVKIHSHASENTGEIEVVESERGMRNVEYFQHLGLTGENLILAHCIWLNENELDILARTGTHAVHCPSSNLKLASGIAAVPDMLTRGIHVSLGADGTPCSNNLDIFNEMRLASLIHKPGKSPTTMPAHTVFELATLGGAHAMGLEKEIGSLEVGKKADLVLVDIHKPHCWPITAADVYAQLVYQARGSDVSLTMVDGQIVYQEGEYKTLSMENCMRRCVESLTRVASRAGLF